jgi:hypothetical protein
MRSHQVAGLLLLAVLVPPGPAAPERAARIACAARMACALPDCNHTDEFAEQLWCSAPPPDPRSRARILTAIGRIRRKGDACVDLAARLDWLEGAGLIRIFEPGDYPGVGGAVPPEGSGVVWLLLSRDFVTTYYDAAHRSGNVDSRGVPRPETLQRVLAHEADHLDGAGHVDLDGYLTPNTVHCGDLPDGEVP